MGKMPKGLPKVQIHPDELHCTDEEWLFGAVDNEGNSVKEWIRIPPALEREIDILIQSRRFPYKTRSDLLRHAALRHVALLHKIEDDITKHLMVFLWSMNELLGDEAIKKATEDSLRLLEERVQHHLEMGDQGEALRVLAMIREKLKDVSDTAGKRRFAAKFQRTWGHLLNGGGEKK